MCLGAGKCICFLVLPITKGQNVTAAPLSPSGPESEERVPAGRAGLLVSEWRGFKAQPMI